MSERPTTGDRERKVPLVGALHHRPLATAESVEPRPGKVIHWGRGRLRQTLPKVVSRCMSYSASPEFDEALMSAVSRFYGVDVDVATAETDILEDDFERVRFFPWFLWDYPLPQAGGIVDDELSFVTVGSRFLEQAELSDFERQVLIALTRSSLAFVEVIEVDQERGEIAVVDVACHDRIEVYDPGLSAELEVGHIALVRLIRLEEEGGTIDPRGAPGRAAGGSAEGAGGTLDPRGALGRAAGGSAEGAGGTLDPRGAPGRAAGGSAEGAGGTIDAIYAVLPHETRPLVEMELERLLGGEREPLTVLKTHAPEILDFAEHVLSTLTEPPVPLNADREPIVLCHTVVPRAQEERVYSLLAEEDSPFLAEGATYVWREDERVVGMVVPEQGRAHVMASSRERFGRLTTWFSLVGEPLPVMRAEATIDAAAQSWLAGEKRPLWLIDPDVDGCVRRSLGRWISRWPDEPHPAIGGRTPRLMAREPGGRDVVARLIARTRLVAGDEAVALEDWLERTPTE